MSIFTRSSNIVRRSLTLGVAMSTMCGASVAVLSAQTSQPAAQNQTVTAPAIDFRAYAGKASADFSDASSSSSSDDSATVAAITNDPLHLNAMQYNGRRRYGRPRYRGGNTNPDGSNKWIFFGGVGLSQPIGNPDKYFTPSYAFQVGGGRQFSSHFALPIQFDFDNFGLTKSNLDNQFALYNEIIAQYNASTAGQANPATPFSSLDGNGHIWSFTVDPTYTFYSGEGLGAYVVGGVGFYHKVTNFTTPETATEEDEFGDIFQFEENGVVDHYTSNSVGVNGGFGLTYKISHFSNQRFYAEVRYVYTPNSQRTGLTVNSPITASSIFVANDYPANSNRTTYLPVKVGIRF